MPFADTRVSKRQDKRAARSILYWAGFGVVMAGVCTSVVPTMLFFDRLKDGAQATVVHAVNVSANSVGEFLHRSEDIVLQVTSRSKARNLLVDLNADGIRLDDYRAQTERILGDALARADHLRGIARFDRRQRLVASVGEAVPARYWPDAVASDGAATISDPFDHEGQLRMAVSAPILDAQGAAIGVDVTLFSLEQLAHLLVPESSHRYADWNLDLFVAIGRDAGRTYYAPSSRPDAPVAPIDAMELTTSARSLDRLRTLQDGLLTFDDHVFAAMAVPGSDWLVLARRSTVDLYGGVYRDIAVSWSLVLLLALAGALAMFVRMRGLTSGLMERMVGLQTDVEATEARYRDLIEGSVQGILIHNDHRPLLVNKAWADIHGYTVEQVMKLKSIQPLIAFKDRKRLSEYKTARLNGLPTPDRYEYRAVHKNGRFVWVENAVRTIVWDGELAIQTTIVDITERKQREATEANHRYELEALVQQRTMEIEEKNRNLESALRKEREYSSLLDQFVAMASHEFRTPLTIIDSVAQRLFRRADSLPPEKLKESALKTRNAVQRMILLIESVLSSSSMDAGRFKMKPQACSLADIVNGVCQRAQDLSPQHRIDVRLGDLPEQIAGDPHMLEQVFSNLLSNAVKYAPDQPHIDVVGFARDGYAGIAVTDQGVGIPAAEQSKLFDRFFRASTSTGIAGTGIGLNLAAQVVELHGGRIEVESAEGRGSTFTVYLPIRALQSTQAVSFNPAPRPPAAQPSTGSA